MKRIWILSALLITILCLWSSGCMDNENNFILGDNVPWIEDDNDDKENDDE